MRTARLGSVWKGVNTKLVICVTLQVIFPLRKAEAGLDYKTGKSSGCNGKAMVRRDRGRPQRKAAALTIERERSGLITQRSLMSLSLPRRTYNQDIIDLHTNQSSRERMMSFCLFDYTNGSREK